MKQISCRVDDELFAAIEAARGGVPRERWMRDVLAAALGEVVAAESPREARDALPPAPPRAHAITGKLIDSTTGEETPVVAGPTAGGEPAPKSRTVDRATGAELVRGAEAVRIAVEAKQRALNEARERGRKR